MHQSSSGIEIRTSFNPLQWVFFFVQPKAAIDGQEYPLKWGTQLAAFAPGTHHVRVWVPYLWGPVCVGETYIEVYPGQISGISYSTPFFTFQQADMRQLGAWPWA